MSNTRRKSLPQIARNLFSPPSDYIQLQVEKILSEILPSLALATGIYYIISAFVYGLTLPADERGAMVMLAAVSSLISFGLAALLRFRPVKFKHVDPVLALMGTIALLNSLHYLGLTEQPLRLVGPMVLLPAAGLAFLSTRWFALFGLAVWMSWVGLGLPRLPEALWKELGLWMFAATIIGTFIHLLRRRINERLIQNQAQAQQQRQALAHCSEQLDTVIQIVQHIAGVLDREKLLAQITELIQQRYQYTNLSLFLLDENTNELIVRAQAGNAAYAERQLGARIPMGYGIVGWAAKRRQSAHHTADATAARFSDAALRRPYRAELAIPLRVGHRLLGVLDIQSDRVDAFPDEDRHLLRLLANQTAIAIQNIALFEAEKTRRQLAETLHSVGRALTRTLDLGEVLSLILDQLHAVVPYDRGLVMLCADDELEIVVARGFPAGHDAGRRRVPIRPGDVFDEIRQTRRPLTVPNVLQRADWYFLDDLLPALSWIGVPLIHEDEILGMLSLARETPTPYTDEEVAFAGTFGGYAAIALQNARLYEEITALNRDLEAKVKARTAELQRAYAELENLDRSKTHFIDIASHELRTPLTILSGYSQLLLTDAQLMADQRYQQMITYLNASACDLHRIIDKMLDMAAIDSRSLMLRPTSISIASLVNTLHAEFNDVLKERRLVFATENLATLPDIEADEEALTKAFSHLISNAIKYTPDGGKITISGEVLTLDGDTVLKLIFSDTGIGIKSTMLSQIFHKFARTEDILHHSRSQTGFKGGGAGLGLAITEGLIEAHGGRIWAESPGRDEETCPGSQFYVILPLEASDQAPDAV
ncbi:MAG: GAF domain-containing protein [Anaerolineales bacterium]